MTLEKDTLHSGPYKDIFAQAVKVGNCLYLAGQVGADTQGHVPDNISGQVQQVYDNIEAVLAHYQAELSNVVDETWFVTDVAEVMQHADDIFRARAQRYGGTPAVAQTLVQVSALVAPEYRVEIKVIAQL